MLIHPRSHVSVPWPVPPNLPLLADLFRTVNSVMFNNRTCSQLSVFRIGALDRARKKDSPELKVVSLFPTIDFVPRFL